MRALLVVNPHATTTTVAARDVLAHALAGELKLEVLETAHRGHAATAAEHAAQDGVELVVVHGGDGTVNEVVNGLLAGTGGPPADPADGPAVAVVPGGSANVFARALGAPRDPLAATAGILAALETGRSTLVGLGRADCVDPRATTGPLSRWFTFNAGMGWDAEVVAEVDRARALGREATPLRYAATALRQYLRERRRPRALSVEIAGAGPVEDIAMAFVCNTDTWTYLGSRAVRTNPGTTFGSGLGLFGLHDLRARTVAPALRQMLIDGGDPRGRDVLRRDAVPLMTVRCTEPVALQVDGEHVGRRREVRFRAVSAALRVVV